MKKTLMISLAGKIALSVLLSFSLFLPAYAQQKVSGTVVDASGVPVIGAGIVQSGTSNGVITDYEGNWSITVPADASIVVSCVGYVEQTFKVTADRSVYNIVLAEDAEMLEETIVIGYGSVKKSNLTSAVSKMNSAAIENRPMARPESALQGQLAGVTVREETGEPGADLKIRVRGAASVNASADPLYVVDGVPLSTLSGVNPSDIESIEVLKDAASAAIYGSRGSNGVVIVTTKRGKSGKPMITFNASAGLATLEKKVDLLSAVEWMEYNIRYMDAYYMANNKNKAVAQISDDNATRRANMNSTTFNNNVEFDDRWFNYVSDDLKATHTYDKSAKADLCLLDWQDEYYKPAVVQNYDLSVSGATENVNYLVSGGYLNQDGLAPGSSYQRLSFRSNVEAKIKKWLVVGINIAPTYTVNKGSGTSNGKDSQSHKVVSACPVSEPGVGYKINMDGNAKYQWAGSNVGSIYYMETNINQNAAMRLLGNAYARFIPFKDLTIEASASANYYDNEKNGYIFSSTAAYNTKAEGVNSSSEHATQRTLSALAQLVANYNHSWGKHNLSAMLGASTETENYGWTTSQKFKNFANDAITGTFNMSTVTATANAVTEKTVKNLISTFARASYNYDEKYMLSASVRYDGCSVFGENNKWGLFPAVSGGWMISNEPFWKDSSVSGWFNSLKLRASYGETGNNSITYSAAYPALSSVTYGGGAGYVASTLGNKDLGWEKTRSTDIALDMAFLDNRIQFSVDWYTKTTDNLLYKIPVPGASGFTETWGNAGSVYNTGFEFEINTHNINKKDFSWSTSFNASYNNNEVLQLGEENTPIYQGFQGSNYSNVLMVGKPINVFWMYDAVGVWMNQKEIDDWTAAHDGQAPTFLGKTIKPGDIKYRDVNGDGIFTEADKDYLGSPTPKWIFGMTNTFRWKNFDASILFTAQTGGKIYGLIGRAIDRPSMGKLSNVMGCWRNAWWSEDNPGDGKTPYPLSSTTGTTLDSRWLYSSDYFRIKNLTIGYRIPFKTKDASSLRVYLSCENLAIIDSYYEGYSPETANGTTSLGYDYSGYPSARTFTLGVNFNF